MVFSIFYNNAVIVCANTADIACNISMKITLQGSICIVDCCIVSIYRLVVAVNIFIDTIFNKIIGIFFVRCFICSFCSQIILIFFAFLFESIPGFHVAICCLQSVQFIFSCIKFFLCIFQSCLICITFISYIVIILIQHCFIRSDHIFVSCQIFLYIFKCFYSCIIFIFQCCIVITGFILTCCIVICLQCFFVSCQFLLIGFTCFRSIIVRIQQSSIFVVSLNLCFVLIFFLRICSFNFFLFLFILSQFLFVVGFPLIIVLQRCSVISQCIRYAFVSFVFQIFFACCFRVF